MSKEKAATFEETYVIAQQVPGSTDCARVMWQGGILSGEESAAEEITRLRGKVATAIITLHRYAYTQCDECFRDAIAALEGSLRPSVVLAEPDGGGAKQAEKFRAVARSITQPTYQGRRFQWSYEDAIMHALITTAENELDRVQDNFSDQHAAESYVRERAKELRAAHSTIPGELTK